MAAAASTRERLKRLMMWMFSLTQKLLIRPLCQYVSLPLLTIRGPQIGCDFFLNYGTCYPKKCRLSLCHKDIHVLCRDLRACYRKSRACYNYPSSASYLPLQSPNLRGRLAGLLS